MSWQLFKITDPDPLMFIAELAAAVAKEPCVEIMEEFTTNVPVPVTDTAFALPPAVPPARRFPLIVNVPEPDRATALPPKAPLELLAPVKLPVIVHVAGDAAE